MTTLDPAYEDPMDGDEVWNFTQNNCTNDYCIPDEDYIQMMEAHIFPRPFEWALIALHLLVFVLGLVGNALVCVAVYRNASMRTVTNFFIVNLAGADFMVILFCLPPTVVWDVTETWFLGTYMCKIILFFQDLSVTVSVLTLTFISIDRCYAVCSPLKFKSTEGRAKWAILVIWIVASVLVSPNLFVLEAIPREGLRIETVYFTQCTPQWSPWMEVAYVLMKVILLYAFPLVLMSIAHCLIAIVLRSRQSVHGSTEENQRPNNVLHRHQRQGSSSLLNRREGGVSTSANCSAESTLRSRRKAAKMLVAVVIVFAICLFPVHLINILRIVMHVPMNDFTVAVTLGSHWLCYANSAINPLIYNFMSVKFRKEFMKAFACRTLERENKRQQSSFKRSPNRTRSEYIQLQERRRIPAGPPSLRIDLPLEEARFDSGGRERTDLL